jgi:hypothetical protein
MGATFIILFLMFAPVMWFMWVYFFLEIKKKYPKPDAMLVPVLTLIYLLLIFIIIYNWN